MELIRLEQVVVGYGGYRGALRGRGQPGGGARSDGRLGGQAVLPPVDLGIRAGVFLGIIGPNGSGKTTLVRTLLGLLPPLAGRVVFPGPRPRFGYVPQRESVDLSFPLRAREIVLMGRYGRLPRGGWPGAADREATLRALHDVGADQLADRPFHALSGGQRQRVLIARALAGQPGVLVLDEPTTGMDLPSERAMLDLVASFRHRGIAVVMVSHHLGAVADYASHLCLVSGPDQPVAVGARDELLTSARLSAIYGQPVTVALVEGRSAIFVGGPPTDRPVAPSQPPRPPAGTAGRAGSS